MIFKEEEIKKYLGDKHMPVKSIYQIDNQDVTDIIDIVHDCEVLFFVDVELAPCYAKFNMKQMLNFVQLDYSDLLKYLRLKKLENLK